MEVNKQKANSDLLRKTLISISMILPIAGVVLPVLLLIGFTKTDSVARSSPLLPWIVFSLVVCFYNFLFGGVSYGILTTLDETRRRPLWLKVLLHVFGITSIALGTTMTWVALFQNRNPFVNLQSLTPYFSVNRVPLGLYGIGFGILCICISALIEIKFDLNWINLINGFMILMVAIFIAGFYLENGFNLIAAFLSGFYNLLFVFLCFGISGAINPEKLEMQWLMWCLLFFGYMAIVLGGIEIIAVFIKPPSFLKSFSYQAISAIFIGLYTIMISTICLGLSRILSYQIAKSEAY